MQEKAIVNDKYKKILAKGAGFLLIEVWENEFNKEKTHLKKYLRDIIDKYDKENGPKK